MEIHFIFMEAKMLLNSLIKIQWTDRGNKEFVCKYIWRYANVAWQETKFYLSNIQYNF